MNPADQLRAAHRLYRDAVRSGAVAPEPLGSRLLALGTAPTHEALLAWAHDFSAALGRPPVDRADIVACAVSFCHELSGKLGDAVFVLGELLSVQRRLTPDEVKEASADVGHEPTTEVLRAVLTIWITRGAAWGGPIVGWMRDLRDRLESRG